MDSHKKRLPDFASIKYQASGKWLQLIPALSSYGPELFDSRKHPCPKCGGVDRFRAFDDFSQEGGVVCSQCHSKNNRDGFSTLQWLNGWSFPDTVRAVAEQLGLAAPRGPRPAPQATSFAQQQPKPKAEKPHPESQLEFQEWSPELALMWCMKKQPITPEALKRFGARIAKYQGKFVVMALPINAKSLAGDPVGWIIYNITGGPLPSRDGPVSKKITWGSDTGVVGMVDRLNDLSARKIKTEGPTDALALLSLNLETTDAIFCNACGAIENPDKEQFNFLPSLVEGSKVVSIGDADKAGEEGVAKWANFFAATAAESRIARLPYEVIPSHGKDLRNWIAEGHTLEDFESLVAAGEVVQYRPAEARRANESPEDPHRLARTNLESYREEHGGELRYWRGQWLKWKSNRYQFLTDLEIEAKVNQRIKIEFDKQWEIDHKAHLQNLATDPDYKKEAPTARRVTAPIVRDTLAALRSLCTISSSVDMGTWLQSKERRQYLACQNCILDIAAFINDAPPEQVFLQHSANWFSTACLPYEFDPTRTCDIFDEFLEEQLGDDPSKLLVLQEFAGYVLSPNNTRTKMLIFEGDAGRGKSLLTNALQAIVGKDNTSSVGLEVIGQRFQAWPTLGKMLNICGEANDIDAPSESFLKNFTGGNPMMFEAKRANAFEALPTAKLLLSWNTAPRFKDRSEGLWRRFIVIRFNRKPRKANPKMLEHDFWLREGQLPGMLNWALLGLKRLEAQDEFTECEESKRATEDIRSANNSARLFLRENYHYREGAVVSCKDAYEEYSRWCVASGMHPVNAVHFGREVNQLYQGLVIRQQKSFPHIGRAWCYMNLEGGESEESETTGASGAVFPSLTLQSTAF